MKTILDSRSHHRVGLMWHYESANNGNDQIVAGRRAKRSRPMLDLNMSGAVYKFVNRIE